MFRYRKAFGGETKRVHIVGLSPRTGTTLMQELMAHCYSFDGVPKHEMSLFSVPEGPAKAICTKSPRELGIVLELGPRRGLWCICMVRDPRDAIVSRHEVRPDEYYTDLALYKASYELLMKSGRQRKGVIRVRYEDLVREPDRVQAELERQIPFLARRALFSDFHAIARPSRGAVAALGGVRRITDASVGNWRNHLPRIKSQIAAHGPIAPMLVELGYEADENWLEDLAGVAAETAKPGSSGPSWIENARRHLRTRRKLLLAKAGLARVSRGRQ